MTRPSRWPGFRWRLLALLLLAGMGLGVLMLGRPSKPAAVVVLHQPVQMPVLLRDRLDRLVPVTRRWRWAWRVEQAVFGKRRPVNLRSDILSLSGTSGITLDITLSSLALGPPIYSDTNGLQVWLLSQDRLKALRGDLKQAYGDDMLNHSCWITTADGIEARLFQGVSFSAGGSTNEVGLALGCSARTHSDSTDLITWITFSELVTNEPVAANWPLPNPLVSIQTNLNAALRLQLPKGKGFFLLDRPAGDPGRKHFAMIVDPL